MSAKSSKKNPMRSDELRKTISMFNKRRKRRLDESELDSEQEDTMHPDETMTEDDEPSPPPATISPDDRVQLIKDRRDRRDQEGDPESSDEALGVIAQQDEDIDELIEIIEELQAKSDFDSTCQDEENEDEENEDEENEDEENEDDDEHGENHGVTLSIQTDSIDAIVRERLKLGRLGDRLNLDGLEEMKPLDAKKAIIKKVNPSMRLDGKGKVYINAAFDAAVAQLASTGGKDTNYQRRQTSNRMDSRTGYTPTGKTSAARARERMIDKMMNGGDQK